MKPNFRSISAIALLMSMTAPNAFADSLSEQVPENTYVFAEWAGTDNIQNYKGSLFQGYLTLIQADKQTEQLTQLLESLQQQHIDPNLSQFIEIAKPLLTELSIRHHMALAIYPSAGGPVPVGAQIIIEAQKPQELKQHIDTTLAQMVPEGMIQVTTQKNEVVLKFGDALEGKSLSKSDAWKNLTKDFNGNPAATIFVNLPAIRQTVEQMAGAQVPPEELEKIKKALTSAGLDELGAIGYAGGIQSKMWRSKSMVQLKGKPKGLVSAILDGQLEKDDLALIPNNSTFVFGLALSPEQIFDAVIDFAESVEPGSKAEAQKGLAHAKRELGGADPEALLRSIDDDWLIYDDPRAMGNSFMSLCASVSLKDKQSFSDNFSKLVTLGNSIIADETDGDVPGLALHEIKNIKGGKQWTVNLPLVSPSLTIHNNRLWFALTPQTLDTCLDPDRKIGKMKNSTLLKGLPKNAQPKAVYYNDLPTIASKNYGMTVLFNQYASGLIDILTTETIFPSMPPFYKIEPLLTPEQGVCWVDKQGLHGNGNTPFPGANIVASNQLAVVAGAGLAAGIFVPVLGKVRQRATHTTHMVNCRSVGLGAMVYAARNKGNLPDNLGSMLVAGEIAPAQLSDEEFPFVDYNAPQAAAKWDEWARANSHFIYLGKGMKDDIDAYQVLAFEDPLYAINPDELNITFKDCSAYSLSYQELDDRLLETTGKGIDQWVSDFRAGK